MDFFPNLQRKEVGKRKKMYEYDKGLGLVLISIKRLENDCFALNTPRW